MLRAWWKAWGELLQRFLVLAASFASMVGLLVVFLPSPRELPRWAVALLVSAGFFLAVLIVLEFLDHRGRRVYAKNDTEGIKKYITIGLSMAGESPSGHGI